MGGIFSMSSFPESSTCRPKDSTGWVMRSNSWGEAKRHTSSSTPPMQSTAKSKSPMMFIFLRKRDLLDKYNTSTGKIHPKGLY